MNTLVRFGQLMFTTKSAQGRGLRFCWLREASANFGKFVSVALLCFASAGTATGQGSATILGWNNLGMHCMDSDYSLFSILPPYNTIEAQLIINGKLVKASGYRLTYEAVRDPSGSINSTSAGKGNFYDFAGKLYGKVDVDNGLAGWNMPGTANVPQQMLFTNSFNWFDAEGIPLTPYDDNGVKNTYPMMRLTARDSANNVLATSDIVLPVSDEMDCSACHASGSYSYTQPAAGWANDPNLQRDYRLNILRLHDERQFASNPTLYANALNARGFSAAGLYDSAANGQPALCATCHASAALGTTSYGTIPQLTQSMHARHASARDPVLTVTLDSSQNRSACYRCHPGSATRCLRGAMGAAVAADGTMAMQCQSCHGTMSQVGAAGRTGWLMEPQCQSCHTGTAASNNGQIRYTSVFDTSGAVRVARNQTFATTPNTPAAGLSLYRFSTGHGGLQCEACHGSTHAEFPSIHDNDNIRNIALQGHVGPMVECDSCHTTVPATYTGGPHGMHPLGQMWVQMHHDQIEHGGASLAACSGCHGTDFRGTVLSQAQGDRAINIDFEGSWAVLNLYRGAIVGCYTCHNGPHGNNANTAIAPTALDITGSTSMGLSVQLTLLVTGNGAAPRIISQPRHGTIGLANRTATYYPEANYEGMDTFTYAAYDGAKNSTLAKGTVTVGPGSSAIPTLATNGNGIVVQSPKGTLTPGKRYTWTARPATGWLFVNWTGSITTNSTTISVVMQDGMSLQANFIPNPFIPAAGTYTGLFFETNGPRVDRSGLVSVQTTSSGAYSGTVQMGATRYPISGKLDLNGANDLVIRRVRTNSLAVSLRVNVSPGADTISGTIGDGTWTANLSGDKAYYDGRTKVAPLSAHYTLMFSGCTNSSYGPAGYGCATMTGSAAGAIVLSGTLAEGTSFSARANLSKNGTWPLYVPLYNGRGVIMSWITNDIGKLNGAGRWCRGGSSGVVYPQGFTNSSTITGCSYTPPAGARVISVTNAAVVLSGAGTNADIVSYVTLTSRNTVTSTNKTVFSIRLATGTFSGSVVDPTTKKAIPFNGILNQRQNAGYGYFMKSNIGGEVYFGD